MDEETFTFSWAVKNFSFCPHKARYPMQSEIFVASMLNDTVWKGCLYPRSHDDPDFISFFLVRCHDKGPDSIGLRATFQLIAADEKPVKEIAQTKNIEKRKGFDFHKFASRSEVEMLYLHKDTLKIQCILRKTKKELITKRIFARTAVDCRKICRGWKLTNFSQMKQGIVLTSTESLSLEKGGELLVDVCISFVERQSGGMMEIEFTRRCEPQGKPMSLDTIITVLDAQEIETEICKQEQHVFHMRTPEEIWKFPTFIATAPLLRQKNKYLVNDVLELKCDSTIFLGTVFSEIQNTSFSVEKSDTLKFTEDMKDLFNSQRFADVMLRVCGEMVPAHRIVLQSRSERFAQMLVDIERTDNIILDIPDVDIMTLKHILKYMYTDEIDDLDYDDLEVAYSAAQKYRIESLKYKYSFILESHLEDSNACKIWMLADNFRDQDLN